MITYPEHIKKALEELADKGFAIAIFTPKELNGVDPLIVEDWIIDNTLEIINFHKNPEIPNFDWENEIEEYPN